MSLPTSAATPQPTAPALSALPYEAPAIESVLSPDDLQREVLYAGTVSISDPPLIPDPPPFGP